MSKQVISARELSRILLRASAGESVAELLSPLVARLEEAEANEKNPLRLYSDEPYDTPRDVKVSVARTGVGCRDITVQGALSDRDAAERALENAGNESFSEHSSEYTVEGIG